MARVGMGSSGPATERRVVDPRGPARVALVGLLLAMLMASLDNTIVATALPTIAGTLGGLNEFAWVTTAYILTASIGTPLYGKLGDLYGRKPVFLFALAVFLVGSALSGAAESMGQLIAFRAMQGIGGGGLIVSAGTIYADLFSPEERPRTQGYFTAVFGASMLAGPLLGGFVTDRLGWRWVFYLNLPLGALALLTAAVALKLPRRLGRPRIDVRGMALLGGLVTCLVLLATWGGTRYAWNSPAIIGLGVGVLVLLVAWIRTERFAAEPVIPLRLFRESIFDISIAVTVLSGFALFGGVAFLPLFLQLVSGASATNSGLLLLPLTVGLLTVSLGAGPLIGWAGIKWAGVAGMGSATIGMGLLSTMTADTSHLASGIYSFLLGIGLGLVMQVYTLTVQNTVPPRDLGAATATVIFARQVGGSFGLSIFGAIFNSRLGHGLASHLPPSTLARLSTGTSITPEAIKRLPPALRHGVVGSYGHALTAVFLVAALVLAAGFLIALFLKQVPLRVPSGPQQAQSTPDP